MTYEELKLKYPGELFNWSIITAYRGSHSHGTYVPSTDENSIDDIDLLSVVVPPKEYYYGLQKFGSRDTKEIKDGKWDVVSYEVRKFVNLLIKGNPNVIGILWLNPEHYVHVSPMGQKLIDARELFVSEAIYHSFIGYAKAQLYKMTHLAFQGYMGQKRKQLVEKFGYDCKNAAHLIRLMRMCNEFLKTKKFQVFREDAQELIAIKTGKWSIEQVKIEADRLFKEGEELFKIANLPKEVDLEKIETLLVDIVHSRIMGKAPLIISEKKVCGWCNLEHKRNSLFCSDYCFFENEANTEDTENYN